MTRSSGWKIDSSVLLIIAISALVVGVCCKYDDIQSKTKVTAAEVSANDIFVKSLLPPNAVIVETLDDNWYVVDITVTKDSKRFLFHWWKGTYGSIGRTLTILHR